MAGLNVLVTGAFGNLGRAVTRELLSRGHRVRGLDLRSRAAERHAARSGGLVEPLWVDLGAGGSLAGAVAGQDAIVHLAFVLPPASETDPDRARAVNVEGSRRLVAAAEAATRRPRVVFASSYSVYGETRHLPGLLTADSPVAPVGHYSRQKVEVEELLRGSGLEACCLRLSAVLSSEMVLGGRIDPLIFDLPADARQEFLHAEDAARAFAACLERDDVWGRTLVVGGGPACQLLYADLINRSLGALGLPPLPASAFSKESRQGGGWLDSSESQLLLADRRWSFDEHLEDLAARAGLRRTAARALGPLIRWHILRRSPYRGKEVTR